MQAALVPDVGAVDPEGAKALHRHTEVIRLRQLQQGHAKNLQVLSGSLYEPEEDDVKRTIAACFAGVLIFAIFAGTASAATPAQRIAKLEKQVKVLTATVKKQQTVINCVQKESNKCVTLKSVVTRADNLAAASLFIETCLAATTADAIQSTWATLDQAMGTTLFGPQQTISDSNTCRPLEITRQGIRTPPTTSVFSALTALLSGSGKAAFRRG